MYGPNVPTSITAGVPGVAAPLAVGWGFTEVFWLVLLVCTVIAALAALCRLVPKKQC